MKIVVQRVSSASVTIGGTLHSRIGEGLMVLVGVDRDDTPDNARWLAAKTVGLRIFDDEAGVMNRSVADIGGEVLAVSQFTLLADARRGNRPSYVRAAGHELAVPLYELYCAEVQRLLGRPVKTGVFGAMMDVALVNSGPVTIVIDTSRS